MRYLAGGRYELGEAAPVHPGLLLGLGLFLSAGAGLVPLFFGGSLLQSAILEATIPVFGHVKFVTTLFFALPVGTDVVASALLGAANLVQANRWHHFAGVIDADLGLRGGDRGGLAGVGGGDLGRTTRLRLLLDPVALGVRRLADLGLELALGQRGLLDRHLLLLREDRLVAVGLRERSRSGGLGCGGIGLGLDLGLLQRQRALGHRDLLLGGDLRLLAVLASVGSRPFVFRRSMDALWAPGASTVSAPGASKEGAQRAHLESGR